MDRKGQTGMESEKNKTMCTVRKLSSRPIKTRFRARVNPPSSRLIPPDQTIRPVTCAFAAFWIRRGNAKILNAESLRGVKITPRAKRREWRGYRAPSLEHYGNPS